MKMRKCHRSRDPQYAGCEWVKDLFWVKDPFNHANQLDRKGFKSEFLEILLENLESEWFSAVLDQPVSLDGSYSPSQMFSADSFPDGHVGIGPWV